MSKGRLIILMGPVAVGKSTILDRLLVELQDTGAGRLITTTTRAPRPNELDGRDFYFLTREEFIVRRDAGGFLETAEHAGNLYGAERKIFEELAGRYDVVLTILNIAGVRQVKKILPDCVTIFLLPKDFSEIEKRLALRPGAASDNPEQRLSIARQEIATAHEWDIVVTNEEGKLDATIEEIKKFLTTLR